jgi:alpha-tubulin suppressor-like RCC1 family protein
LTLGDSAFIPFDGVASVSAGAYHTVAIKTNGTLWAWGWNDNGQLGLGDRVRRDVPVQVGTDTDWATVSAGLSHTVAIKTDGTLWAWGYNGRGQLGLGDTDDRDEPTQVTAAGGGWATVSAGVMRTVATKGDGTLWSWGFNGFGQLGLGDTNSRYGPASVAASVGWSAASAGGYHMVAMDDDGALWACGWNNFGQNGDGTTAQSNAMAAVDDDYRKDFAVTVSAASTTGPSPGDGTSVLIVVVAMAAVAVAGLLLFTRKR